MTLGAKWHLDSVLGVGGMAAVYAATHRNGKRGAVKLMHKSLEPEMRQRFLREGRIANSVDHDGVVSVLDDDIAEDGSAFLVMELLDGEALSERAAKTHNRLSVDLVLDVADQVLDALAAAHEKEIIHRDVKPGNIFLLSDGRVKLLDFGIAHLADPSSSSVTFSGIAMGTPAFMAPEQACARWDLVGPASDLWSVGATMFTLLTGDFIHQKASFHEMLVSAINTPVRSLALALPGAPASVVALVDRALERRLADRWQDAREMQAAVRAAYHAISGEYLRVRSRRPTSTPRIRLQAPAPQPQSAGSISCVATKIVPPTTRWRRTAATVVAGLALVVAATATTARWGGAQAAARRTTIASPTRVAEIASASTPTAPSAAPSAATPTAIALSQNPTAIATPRRATIQSPTPRSAASTSPTETARPAPQTPTETHPKSLFDRRR